ncbi:biotin--[acetyl-CoA-carboxylase] ligase [Chelatococcus asaccharovorans]|uniref:biotin--[biotin carboxyl-carrier protein] ligase n=1 Tax=Chelatococcus asaccharovorans TaxID=28210 RepID=A0A2V3UC60_9HYPH|nr:biotin--[acetyl-CoA-carboxylase] ligase [Chelatococcus asaccharovorans]MBS7703380.1 biotin--[acetyl-CoA-carboxylase] ligase [Chelatococcus asaccharovorans]PXW61718.1 BirA family biotin operon repressor/biotin-[acetyl-CoA-carboxylase] ligase [Chelatococcus asaccharovorans]
MVFSLGQAARTAGFALAAFESLGSTNAEAMAIGKAGLTRPTWVVTARQTAGRGRRGNAWANGSGNLAASLVMVTTVTPAVAATLGFVAGLALTDAIAAIAPYFDSGAAGGHRLLLKWPNDVMGDGAKLAGILLESEQLADGRRIVVVGIGVNVAAAPEGMPYKVASLSSLGAPVTAEDVFSALTDSWVEGVALWDEGRGVGAIRSRWLKRAAGLGADVAVHIGREIVRGTFETIDDSGQLVIRRTEGGTVAVAAGDVHFGAAATARV